MHARFIPLSTACGDIFSCTCPISPPKHVPYCLHDHLNMCFKCVNIYNTYLISIFAPFFVHVHHKCWGISENPVTLGIWEYPCHSGSSCSMQWEWRNMKWVHQFSGAVREFCCPKPIMNIIWVLELFTDPQRENPRVIYAFTVFILFQGKVKFGEEEWFKNLRKHDKVARAWFGAPRLSNDNFINPRRSEKGPSWTQSIAWCWRWEVKVWTSGYFVIYQYGHA